MSHIDNGDFEPRVVDLLDDAIIAHPDAPRVPLGQLPPSARAWIGSKRMYGCKDAPVIGIGKSSECFLRSRQDSNGVH